MVLAGFMIKAHLENLDRRRIGIGIRLLGFQNGDLEVVRYIERVAAILI